MGLGPGALEDLELTRAMPDPAFWASQRVFLTGHTGFKGAWMLLWLERLGAQVFGYALAPDQAPESISSSATTGLTAVCQTTAWDPYSAIDQALSTTWCR